MKFIEYIKIRNSISNYLILLSSLLPQILKVELSKFAFSVAGIGYLLGQTHILFLWDCPRTISGRCLGWILFKNLNEWFLM